MAVKIQIRRDTATNFASTNPTLAAGELGYETDTGKFKIGDGVTAWTSISSYVLGTSGYSGASGVSGASLISGYSGVSGFSGARGNTGPISYGQAQAMMIGNILQ